MNRDGPRTRGAGTAIATFFGDVEIEEEGQR